MREELILRRAVFPEYVRQCREDVHLVAVYSGVRVAGVPALIAMC